MDENIQTLISLKKRKKLKTEIIKKKYEGFYKNQLTEYINLKNKINSIKKLLTYKHNLMTPDYSKFDKFFYLNKRIKSSSFQQMRQNNSNYDTTPNRDSSQKTNKKKNSIFSLDNSVLKKIFSSVTNQKVPNTTTHISYESKNNHLNTISTRTISPYLFSKKKLFYSPNVEINRHQNENFYKKKYNNNISLYLDIINNKKKFTNYLEKKNNYILSNKWYMKYNYKYQNVNFIQKKKNKKVNFKKINKIYEMDIDNNEEDLKNYEKYFLRGLSLSKEQNYYYQKCKKIDYLFYNDENNNKNGQENNFTKINNNDIYNTAKSLNSKFIDYKRNYIQNKNKNKFIKNKICIKYSLKDLLKTNNPIKIKI